MKKLFLLFLILFIINQSNAQTFFGPENPITKPSIAHPEYFDATDLDGDGDLDALIVSRGTESIAWLENLDGNGNFGETQFLAEGLNQPSNSIGVDVDGDGDNDVVSAIWGTNQLFWLENLDGLGNFGPIIPIDNYASGIWRVRNADVDGDGDQDLLSAEREGGNIIWYENTDGNGTFSDEKYIFEGPDNSNLRDAFPVDLDNDGDVDVVTVDWFLKILAWHENTDGLGTFSDPIQISNAVDDIDIVYCKDFDKDGFQDILARNRTHMFWIKNLDGGNTFGQPVNISQGEGISDYFPTDFDGDNDEDILVSSGYFSNLGWYENNGQGGFSALQIIPNDIGGADFIHAADLDGDGDQDFIGMSWTKSWVYWHENTDGNGNTQFPKYISKPDIAGPYDMAITDLNGDGEKEILLASRYEHKLYFYERMSRQGEYGDIHELSGFVLVPSAIFPADIDGDGKVDVLSASFNDGVIYWSRNMGNNQYGLPLLIGEVDNSATDVYGADMDGDGDIDVLGTSLYSNKLMLFENKGSGNFSQGKLVSDDLGGAFNVIAVNLDGDGDLDIAVASRYDDKISWFENMGNLNFSAENIIDDDMNGTRCLAAGDFDGDGDMDLTATAYDVLRWYENSDGRAEFIIKNIDTQDYLRDINDIETTDIDGDGDLDIFLASEDTGYANWFMNDENGTTFIPQILIGNGLNEPSAIGFEDVDKDGRTDIILASLQDNKIGWYKNEEYPVFIENPQDLTFCQTGTANYSIVVDKADSYQWQISRPYENWYENIEEGGDFSGTQTPNLVVNVGDAGWDMSSFRCIVSYMGAEFFSEEGDLNVDQFIQANAGDDQEVCTPWAYMNGNFPGNSTGHWSTIQGSGVFDDPANEYTIVNGLQHGTNIFKWTIINGTCMSEDIVQVTKFDSVNVNMPFDTLKINGGDQAVISTGATGDVIAYQWYKDGQTLVDDGRITGATDADLTIKNITFYDQGNYKCVIQGRCNYVYTKNVYLAVLVDIIFLQQPQEVTFCESGMASFSVSADNVDTYQWQISWPFTNWFEDIQENTQYTGTQTPNLIVNVENTNLDQARFRCVVTYLDATFNSEPAFLNVDYLIYADAGFEQEICVPWTNMYANYPGEGIASWSIVQGSGVFEDPSNNSTLITEIPHGTNIYKWTITNGSCVSEDFVNIIKYDSITVEVPIKSLELTEGEQAVLYVETTGDISNYFEWYKEVNLLMDDGRITGSSTAQLTIDNVTLDDAGRYYCSIGGQCNYIYTEAMNVTVLTVGTDDLTKNKVIIFPNPSTDKLYVKSDQIIKEYQLLNTSGLVIKDEKTGEKTFSLDLKSLAAGMYYLVIKQDNNRVIERFIVE